MKPTIKNETFFDLAYFAGRDNLAYVLDMDSRELYGLIMEWILEFEPLYTNREKGMDYFTLVYNFYHEKKRELICNEIQKRLPKLNVSKYLK